MRKAFFFLRIDEKSLSSETFEMINVILCFVTFELSFQMLNKEHEREEDSKSVPVPSTAGSWDLGGLWYLEFEGHRCLKWSIHGWCQLTAFWSLISFSGRVTEIHVIWHKDLLTRQIHVILLPLVVLYYMFQFYCSFFVLFLITWQLRSQPFNRNTYFYYCNKLIRTSEFIFYSHWFC